MSVSFLWTKKVNKDFLTGEKKICIFFIFLNSCLYYVLLSFLPPNITFCKLFFDLLLLLITYPCPVFSRLFIKIVRGICGHIKVRGDNHPSCLSCSCFRLWTCSTCSLWSEKIWVLAGKRRTYSARKSAMRKKKQMKKRYVVGSDESEENSFLDGSTTSQGLMPGVRPIGAGGKTHWGPASVAQLDAPSDWRPGGRGFNPRRGRQHSFVEIDHEIFSTVILSLPLIQEGQLSVSGERMCTILVNRLED